MKSTALLRLVSLILGIGVCVALLSASVTQEIPRGSLHGVVTMKENKKPLAKAWVTLVYKAFEADVEVPALSVTGEELQPMHINQSESHRYQTDKNGEFSVSNLRAGVYLVDADARAHTGKRQAIYISEGEKNEVSLALAPKDPELELYSSQRVFTPGDKPSFEIRGFDQVSKATVHYYRLDLGAIVAKGGLNTLLYSFSRPGNPGGNDPSKSAIESQQFDKPLSKHLHAVFTMPIDLPQLGEGFYYVRCDVGQNSRTTYLNISTIGLVTETSRSSATCYVADLVTGKPISGVAIESPGASGLQKVASTNSTGVAIVTAPQGSLKKALLVATYGKSQAVVDFDNESSDQNGKNRVFIYSDRPIYRPGDTVQFKGIIRQLNGLAYKLPSVGQVQIEIRDSDETAMQKFALPLSPRGTFAGSFKSNVEDKPGVYSINAKFGSAEYTYYVNLAAYRKPEFSITVEPTKKYFIYGDRASATVKAEYYFGGPVVGAKVQAYVTRTPLYSPGISSDDQSDDESGDDSGGDSGYYNREFSGEYSEQVDAVTNEKGEAVIQFDTKTDGDPDVPDYDLSFAVSASITDASNKYFEGTGDVTVDRGDVSADVEVDRYMADPGDTVNASVTVTRQDNDEPVAGRDVSIQVGTETWDNDKATFTPITTLNARTDAKGVATVPIKVGNEGSIVLKSTVTDNSGHAVKSEAYLYVEGDRMFGPADKFTVTLDKRSYQIGDKCKVLIQTDKPGGSALVTILAEKVLASYVVNLTKQSTVLTIPVTHDYTPNVWVSAIAIKNRHELEAESRLNVQTQEHDLKISVTPDKPDYLPGDTAQLTIKTTDAKGKPVPADVSVGVVDESIYAIKNDSTNIKRGFYPMRENQVRTNYSFEEIYLDGGDKAGGNIPIRSKFLDTASWQPTLETDASGNAHTAIKLPDNLTSWRATCVGVSDATQVGLTRVNFRARKPLSVRLELPSFLVQQDTQRVTAIVTNDTGKDQEVNVSLDAQGVKVDGDLTQKVHVSAAKPLALTWDVQTPQSGPAQFTAKVWVDGGPNDGEARTVNIEPHGRLMIENHSGPIKDGTVATFKLSNTADPHTGRLLLSISPSIGSAISQSLDELIDFPYGCTEQTMSRFLPTVVLSKTLKDMNIRFDLQQKVPAIVASGFARLAKMQHSNGSWGWWQYDDADNYMTAYVLHGLKLAKEAGFESNEVNTANTVTWGKKQMTDAVLTKWNQRDFLYLCYALSLYGVKDEVRAGLDRVKPVGSSQWALVAMTDDKLGDSSGRGESIAQLHRLVKEEGDIARFDDSPWEYGREAAAFPLLALTTAMPQDPIVGKLVNYLVASRHGDMWGSTRDTSICLIALTQYMAQTHDNGQAADLDIVVNGDLGSMRRIHFDPADQFNPNLKVTIPINQLKPGENRIEFHRPAGSGLCYYSGDLRQVQTETKLLPVAGPAGLAIARSYYLLEPQHMEDGGLELRPTKRSIDQAKSGDIIQVQLTISSDTDREFIMIEDPIPSGCRITEREYVDEGEEWANWWSQTIVLDDRAAFFMRYLPKGVQKLSYTMRAEQIGAGHALPTNLSNMYDPSQTVSGGETPLEVTQ